ANIIESQFDHISLILNDYGQVAIDALLQSELLAVLVDCIRGIPPRLIKPVHVQPLALASIRFGGPKTIKLVNAKVPHVLAPLLNHHILDVARMVLTTIQSIIFYKQYSNYELYHKHPYEKQFQEDGILDAMYRYGVLSGDTSETRIGTS
ncbi:MAG: hypothetical protein EZS28_055407, partial [Streblomastix strix]